MAGAFEGCRDPFYIDSSCIDCDMCRENAPARQAAVIGIIRLLLAAGANPSITNESGKKPADYVTDAAITAMVRK